MKCVEFFNRVLNWNVLKIKLAEYNWNTKSKLKSVMVVTWKALPCHCSAEECLTFVPVSCSPWFWKGGHWINVKHNCIIPSVPSNLRNFGLHLLSHVWAHDTRQNSSCRFSKILHLNNGSVWAMGYFSTHYSEVSALQALFCSGPKAFENVWIVFSFC